MLRKSIFTLVILILISSVFSPLGTANAQEPLPPPPPSHSDRQLPNGAVQDEKNGDWYMPEGVQPLTLDNASRTVGGPDEFGYTWNNAVALSWIDVTGGIDTGLTGYADATGAITLPFPFKYYENTYNQLYIAAPGYISFTQAGYWDTQSRIPDVSEPNNVIAPYWSPNYIGAGSWVRYMSGGVAPNRYFVVEWHDVKGGDPSNTIGSDDTFRFETILYENGDIVFQYQAMTYNGTYWCSSSGIEDSIGLDGLSYGTYCNQVLSFKAVRFYRPTPAARVKISPATQGSFTLAGVMKSFQINVRNTGDIGIDTYDLTMVSPWSATLYAADGVTPLSDTDADSVIDTGSVSQGGAVTIVVKIATPVGAVLGNANTATLTARSSLNITKSKTATLQSAVPAPFAQTYIDGTDGAMSLELIWPESQVTKKAAVDGTYGSSAAVTSTPNGDFIYSWIKGRCLDDPCSIYVNEIEYTLLDRFGNTVRAVGRLTDHSSATMRTYDTSPSVAVAPNGTIGISWYRYLYNSSTSEFNYNIYFAALDGAGNLTSGPANITNNMVWGTSNTLNVPRLYSPQIVATGDNRFVLGWESELQAAAGDNWVNDIYYAVIDTNGSLTKSVTKLTNDAPGPLNSYYDPVLTALSSNRAFLSWVSRQNGNDDIHFAILGSDGNIVKGDTDLSVDETVVDWRNYDAVQLPDGKIIAVWEAWGCRSNWVSGLRFALLDSSYNLIAGTTKCLGSAAIPTLSDTSASVTADLAGHAIITWMDGNTANIYYALVDGGGNILTPPMIYKTSPNWIETSYNGQGNAPLPPSGSITGTVKDASGNPITGVAMTVSALQADGTWLTSVTTNPADGAYILNGLPLGLNIKVSASDDNFPAVYGTEYYSESALLSAATVFNLSAGTPSYSGIDFTLPPAARPAPIFEHLTFNVRAGRVLNDPLIRRAIAFGTDRERMLKAFLGGNTYGVVLNSLIAPAYWSQPAYNQVSIYPYNPAQAMAILDAAGITDHNGNGIRDIGGNDIVLDFKTTQSASRITTSAIFAENMAAIGLQANVTNMPSDEFFSSDPAVSPLLSGDFDIVQFAWVGGNQSVDDSYPMSVYQTGNSQNSGGYSNATADAEYTAAFAATNRADMLPHVLAYYAATTLDMPSLPLFTRAESAVMVDTVSGVNVLADLSSTGVTVLYQNAATSGSTAALASVINPGDIPANSSLVALYEIGTNATMLAGTGATVCVNYNDAGLTPAQENNLQLYHLTMTNARAWTNISTTRDTVANRVCGSTTSFSTFAVLMDTSIPSVTSIVRTNTNPSSASTVGFTVTFSGAVTGVDVSDYSLATTGSVSGAAVSGVSGSGSVYTVTVNTGSGNGTIRLDVTDNDTILDSTLNPLGGTGTGNGNFSSGETYNIDKITPTVVSSLRTDADPTDLASVNFAVTFSESVTGVDVSDFSLTTSGVLGAAISGVGGSGNVYTVTVSTGSGSGTIRLDVVDNDTVVDVALNPLGGNYIGGESYTVTKTWIFGDTPDTYWANSFVERLYNAGITSGCSTIPLNYCPESTVTRAQMAIFLLKGIHGSSYSPPAVNGDTTFIDVATNYWAAPWIKQLAVEGITSGCGGGNYCPEANVTRAQMAIFLLKAKHGTSYSPPAATGVFTDVPVGYWARNWIEQLAVEGITSGCGVGVYCPEADVTRAQMAVFLVKTFNLP